MTLNGAGTVSSQSAYPTKTSPQLEDISSDLSTLLTTSLSSALTPSPQLTIVPQKKSWLMNIDALILSDCGNILDVVVIAIHAALWDLRIPRTRAIEFEAREGEKEADGARSDGMKALLKKRKVGHTAAAEFDLEDHADEGERWKRRETLPIAITLNLVSSQGYLQTSSRLHSVAILNNRSAYNHSSTPQYQKKKAYPSASTSSTHSIHPPVNPPPERYMASNSRAQQNYRTLDYSLLLRYVITLERRFLVERTI